MSYLPSHFQAVIDEAEKLYGQGITIQTGKCIPTADDIPLKRRHWLRIPDVISVFVDMKDSTQLSAKKRASNIARAYQFFTGTAVDLFHKFDAPYIDVRGDGVFGLFNQDQVYLALAAAVTFKTFVEVTFTPRVKEDANIELGAHIGIDQGTVLVHRIGLKKHNGRTDRQNEVWAGKPVNMSSKLAGMGEAGELLVSDHYFRRIIDERARKSRGCPGNTKIGLWTPKGIAKNSEFGLNEVYHMKAYCCEEHAEEYCNAIIALDQPAKAFAR